MKKDSEVAITLEGAVRSTPLTTMKNLFVLFCALAAMLAVATPDAARIDEIAAWLPEKPAADGARIADRAAWAPLASTPYGAKTLKDAEARLTEPVPDAPDAQYLEFSQTGNRSHYEASLFRRLDGFCALATAECLENKGRFLPKIVAYVEAFAAQKSWVLPAHDVSLSCFKGKPHIDLVSARISLVLALYRDWLGDRLPAATRDLIAAELERRTFQPYLALSRGTRMACDVWFHIRNNWNSVCHACVVRAALATVEDRRLRATFVACAEEAVPYAMSGYTPDGYCSEGMGYWNYGYGHHLQLGLAVRNATGGRVDLFADPKCRAVMDYAYGYQIDDGVSPNFADGGGNADAVNLALGRQIWPDLVSTKALRAPAFTDNVQTFSLRAFGQEPAPAAPTRDVLPARTWFPDAQVLLARAARPERTLKFGVAAKGGHNDELHNHNDLGSYTILLDGVEMAGDPGGEVYTRRTFSRDRYQSKVLNSYGHPVPVVGGKLQSTGRRAAARVLRADFTPERDVLVLDLTAAYAVPALTSLVRTFTFDRAKLAFTVSDHITCSAPTAFEVPVISYRTWRTNDEATEFVFDKSATTFRKMTMAVSASAPVTFRHERIENPGRADVPRLAFAFAAPVRDATFTTTFSTDSIKPSSEIRMCP